MESNTRVTLPETVYGSDERLAYLVTTFLENATGVDMSTAVLWRELGAIVFRAHTGATAVIRITEYPP